MVTLPSDALIFSAEEIVTRTNKYNNVVMTVRFITENVTKKSLMLTVVQGDHAHIFYINQFIIMANKTVWINIRKLTDSNSCL